ASPGASVTCYRRAKDIFVVPVVETKNKLVQIQRQILAAHAVISADHATLQQRPERLNAVRVDRTANIFALHVRDGRMRETGVNQLAISARAWSQSTSLCDLRPS